MNRNPVILAGNSNIPLARKICAKLKIKLGQALVTTFGDGEIRVEIGENVRGRDVFVIQSGYPTPNESLMELLIMLDALKRASATRITVVMPYFPYARQDRKMASRQPISSKLVADLMTTAGAHRLLTMDLHVGQIQGFFNIPVDNLYANPIFIPFIQRNYNGNLVVVSPDAGGAERARAYAKKLNATLAIVDKRRDEPGRVGEMRLIGNVLDKKTVIVDDMVASGGTLDEAAKKLLQEGALSVSACVPHAILSGNAQEKLSASPIKQIVVTNTIHHDYQHEFPCPKIHVLSVAPLFARAIDKIHREDSVSSLFE